MRFKSVNITTKLIVPVLLCILGINGALIAYTTTYQRNHAVSLVRDHALTIAGDSSGFVKLVPAEVILAEAGSDMWTEIIISTILTILGVFAIAFIIHWQIRPLRQIAAAAEKVALGNLDYDAIKTTDDEVGKVNASFKNMVMSLREITTTCQALAIGDFSQRVTLKSSEDVLGEAVNLMVENIRKIVKQLKEITKGGYSTDFQPFSDKDQLGVALTELIGALRKMTAENDRQNILKTGQMELHSQMRGEQDMTALSKNVIAYLCEYLNAPIGAFYVMDEEEGVLSLAGSFAYQSRKQLSNHFLPGEGLVGQAAMEKQRLQITDIPEDYIRIQSGLGNATPRSIVVCPLIFENTVKGVVELGAFQDFSDTHLAFLDQVSSTIAIALNSAQARTRTKILLEQTQKQADLLQHQQEALRKSNLELGQQASALKQSESRLQTQQEELRQTNEELQEQTQLLEEQKEDIQKKNLELEMAGKLIEEKARALERTSRYKSEFLANMSHELRTPLNSILLLSKLVSDNKDGNLTEKQIEFARTIHASGSDLLILINEVLDLSKVESGKMELHLEPVALNDLAEVMKRNFQPIAQKKGLDFVVDLHDNLPTSIVTDRQRTEQIIKNFLSNAFKFTSSGRVSFTICPAEDIRASLKNLTSAAAIAFVVSDTGIGIPRDKQQLVFEAFKQADGTTNRKYGGTGLGLSISVELAKYLGGEIKLESQEGKGSAFILLLPSSLDQPVYPEKAQPVLEKKSGPQSPKAEYLPPGIEALRDDRKNLSPEDKSVLIIEDDPHVANILSDLSHAKAFKVLLADNGETGLHFSDYHKPAAIILKADLPGMDGWGVLNRLKQLPGTRYIPVFLYTEKELTSQQEMVARQYLDAVILKRAGAPEKLADEVAIFLQRMDAGASPGNQTASDIVHDKDATLKNKRILLVDDDMRNVYAITNILEEKGMKVIVGKNGKEGIDRLDKEPHIDLVLMDIMMPVMDGYEAMKEIRKQKQFEKLPIIALTAKAMKGDRALCIEAGANDYLAKPFETEKLLSMLRVWLY
ncbi:MAG: response regulator [Deltaproteobacteria bacterium]|nr:response regulator [Deltaproteobacteria bacterium]